MGSLSPESRPGRRLLHVEIEEIAHSNPTRPFASLPYDDDDLSKGYEAISYATFANAIHTLSWFLESCLGQSHTIQTFTHIGQSDLRYMMMLFAAARTQNRVLFSSHMHSKDAHLSLMEKTDSTALFISTGTDVSDVLADRPMKHYVIPELDELLYAPPAHPYPYDKSYEEAAYDDYLILHSSGSTGPPKPITFNHACTSCLDMQNSVPDIDPITKQTHRRVEAGTRMLIPFLPFHGIVAGVLPSPFIFYGTVYVPGMRNRATKVTDIFPILENANVKDTFLSPAMIEDIVQDPRAAEYLSKFDTVSYGGAKLNATTCESVAKYTYLRNRWGITENGTCIHYQTAPQDYAYVAFNTRLSGMRFEPIPNTDASDPSQVPHKLYLDPTPTALPYQPYFHRGGPPASRKLESWDVGDTWLPHPDPKLAPFTFRFVGRVDDLISFKDGLNFHPTDWETAHSDHPLVRSAILAGMGHRQVVLLLELHDDAPLTTTEGRKEVMERLWKESIEPINARCPKNGRVGSLENITVQQ